MLGGARRVELPFSRRRANAEWRGARLDFKESSSGFVVSREQAW
jgi:hypothetical protein